MVEVEAAEKQLVGLAGSRVLRRDQAGNPFQHLSRAQVRYTLDFVLSNPADRRGWGVAYQPFGSAQNDDLLDGRLTRLVGTRGREEEQASEQRDQCSAHGGQPGAPVDRFTPG